MYVSPLHLIPPYAIYCVQASSQGKRIFIVNLFCRDLVSEIYQSSEAGSENSFHINSSLTPIHKLCFYPFSNQEKKYLFKIIPNHLRTDNIIVSVEIQSSRYDHEYSRKTVELLVQLNFRHYMDAFAQGVLQR